MKQRENDYSTTEQTINFTYWNEDSPIEDPLQQSTKKQQNTSIFQIMNNQMINVTISELNQQQVHRLAVKINKSTNNSTKL